MGNGKGKKKKGNKRNDHVLPINFLRFCQVRNRKRDNLKNHSKISDFHCHCCIFLSTKLLLIKFFFNIKQKDFRRDKSTCDIFTKYIVDENQKWFLRIFLISADYVIFGRPTSTTGKRDIWMMMHS